MRKFYLCFFIILFQSELFSEDLEKVVWPLEQRLPISGSFAEFRNTHLHMGCDFKTYGINGFPVLAVFGGHLSSLSYSEFGYGLTFWLSSASGKLSARYAHLHDLKGEVPGLDEFRNAMLLLGNREGFSVRLKPGLFSVKQGMKSARSGETGSGVSHLHLEIFNGQKMLNPLGLADYWQKDITPPEIQTVYADSEAGSYSLTFKKVSEKLFVIEGAPILKVHGPVKIRIGGYDIMTSPKNKNNVFRLSAEMKGKQIFQKVLDAMTAAEASKKETLYDINKSSLSPPMYVYNFFSPEKNAYTFHSRDLGDKTETLKFSLGDASGNVSNAEIRFAEAGNSEKVQKQKTETSYSSADRNFSLDFSRNIVTGNGGVVISEVKDLPENAKKEGFIPSGKMYHVTTGDFVWKGDARGTIGTETAGADSAVYVYDFGFGSWLPLKTVRRGKSMEFYFVRTGIFAVMQDKSPPRIGFPYLLYRDYYLPDLKTPEMTEKFYEISDLGSGIAPGMTVLLEGAYYPYEYDTDRSFIRIEIPNSFSRYKKNLMIQIQVKDKAGNKSDWFTDFVKLK